MAEALDNENSAGRDTQDEYLSKQRVDVNASVDLSNDINNMACTSLTMDKGDTFSSGESFEEGSNRRGCAGCSLLSYFQNICASDANTIKVDGVDDASKTDFTFDDETDFRESARKEKYFSSQRDIPSNMMSGSYDNACRSTEDGINHRTYTLSDDGEDGTASYSTHTNEFAVSHSQSSTEEKSVPSNTSLQPEVIEDVDKIRSDAEKLRLAVETNVTKIGEEVNNEVTSASCKSGGTAVNSTQESSTRNQLSTIDMTPADVKKVIEPGVRNIANHDKYSCDGSTRSSRSEDRSVTGSIKKLVRNVPRLPFKSPKSSTTANNESVDAKLPSKSSKSTSTATLSESSGRKLPLKSKSSSTAAESLEAPNSLKENMINNEQAKKAKKQQPKIDRWETRDELPEENDIDSTERDSQFAFEKLGDKDTENPENITEIGMGHTKLEQTMSVMDASEKSGASIFVNIQPAAALAADMLVSRKKTKVIVKAVTTMISSDMTCKKGDAKRLAKAAVSAASIVLEAGGGTFKAQVAATKILRPGSREKYIFLLKQKNQKKIIAKSAAESAMTTENPFPSNDYRVLKASKEATQLLDSGRSKSTAVKVILSIALSDEEKMTKTQKVNLAETAVAAILQVLKVKGGLDKAAGAGYTVLSTKNRNKNEMMLKSRALRGAVAKAAVVRAMEGDAVSLADSLSVASL